jgi:hypothetical protein
MSEDRRAYYKQYYQAHKLELSEKRKAARLAKLASMSAEEKEALRERTRAYQKEYRRLHPDKVAFWTTITGLRKIEKCRQEQKPND